MALVDEVIVPLILTGFMQGEPEPERWTESLHNINMKSPAQRLSSVHDDMPLAYVDLETIEYQPPRQPDCQETIVWFKLQPDDNAGIPISYALGNGCDDLIDARTPAPWDGQVSAKLSFRVHVSISLKGIL